MGDWGEAEKISDAGDGAGETRPAGNGGTGGGDFGIRLDDVDASVFCKKMRYIGKDKNGTTTH
jgi:hypothetical protein